MASDQTAKWKSLRSKQNRWPKSVCSFCENFPADSTVSVWALSFLLCIFFRLWDKVVALQRKPVPGRSRFMERMRATVSFLFLVKPVKMDWEASDVFSILCNAEWLQCHCLVWLIYFDSSKQSDSQRVMLETASLTPPVPQWLAARQPRSDQGSRRQSDSPRAWPQPALPHKWASG